MKKSGFAAAILALLTAACSPAGNEDVDDIEEMPDADDLGEPKEDDVDRIDAITLTLMTRDSDSHGAYLTDGAGRALYLFSEDARAIAGTEPTMACNGACLAEWPPALTIERPFSAETIDKSLVGMTGFEDRMIATYGGWPLYYFADDGETAIEPRGQGLTRHGGLWSLVGPDGEMAGKKRS